MTSATRFLFLACALVLFAQVPLLASADMLISPTRALMDADNRSATLVLRNTSQGARTYRLMWEDKRVNEAGNYVMVEPDENWPSASGMIRFSPRQITVGPGENQTVRLNFRPPADLKPGEYRSHLKLQVIGEESEPAGVFEMDDPDREGVSFRLFMQMSFSIPVIARYKVSAPEVKIVDVAVVPATNQTNMALAITLERTGEASSSGDLIVEMQRNANSPVERIGSSKEVSVFHETSRKIVKVSLRDSAVPAGAWIRVAYEGSGEYKGRLWDERVFQSK